MPPLIGRRAELVELGGALAFASAGTPVAVLVHGPAGIGKSQLIREFTSSTETPLVAWVSGDEAEMTIPLGVVDQLWAALGATRPADVQDPLHAGAGLIRLLSDLTGPAVVVIDDVQWIDPASMTAIRFALRRLAREPLLAVFASRTASIGPLPEAFVRFFDAAPHRAIALGGLSEADLRHLATSRGHQVRKSHIRRIHDATGGNPLLTLATLTESAAASSSVAPLDFAAHIRSRVAELAPDARRFLGELSVLRTLADQGDPPDLTQAIDAKLIDFDHGTMRIAHPLIRSAIYEGLDPTSRRKLHRRAAGLTDGVERLHHLAAATRGVDADLAEELSQAGRNLAEANDLVSACELFKTAERLSEPGPSRDRYMLVALELAAWSADAPPEDADLRKAEQAPESAHRELALGVAYAMRGDRGTGINRIERAWKLAEGTSDHAVAGRAAYAAANIAARDARSSEALQWAGRARDSEATAFAHGLIHYLSAVAHTQLGITEQGLVDAVARTESQAEIDGVDLARGVLLLWSDQTEAAQATLSALERRTRVNAPFAFQVRALVYLADASYRLGQWSAAAASAELAASLASASGAPVIYVMACGYAATVSAAQGDQAAAQRQLDEAIQGAAEMGDTVSLAWSTQATARVAHTRGDGQTIVDALNIWWLLREAIGVVQPGMVRWMDLYGDGLILTGRAEEAIDVIATAMPFALNQGNRSAQHAYGRVLADAHAANTDVTDAGAVAAVNELFDQCLGIEPDRLDLDHGLAALSAGRWYARTGRVDQARDHLRRAEHIFDHLGAEAYAVPCRAELRRCGVSPGSATSTEPTLSPQEFAVCSHLAAGMTNREIADQLVLSVKTIEYHVSNAFRKSGAANRTALASWFAARFGPVED